MKILKIKKMIFAAIVSMIIIAGVMQSCNNDIDATLGLENNIETMSTIGKVKSENRDKIINSKVFQEYIDANIEFTKTLETLDSIPIFKHLRKDEQNGIANDGRKYNKVACQNEIQMFNKVLFRRNKLLNKYPELAKLSFVEMKSLVVEAALKSEIIRKKLNDNGLFNKKKQNVRRKIGIYEGNGIFAFDNIDEAFLSAMFFTMISGNECAGYVLANGTAVLYINPNGQQTSGSYPVPFRFECNSNVGVAIYNGQEVITTYHTHPDGSTSNYSTTDNNSQIQYFQDCPMIILYEGAAYYYNYNNGYNNGTPSAIWYY